MAWVGESHRYARLVGGDCMGGALDGTGGVELLRTGVMGRLVGGAVLRRFTCHHSTSHNCRVVCPNFGHPALTSSFTKKLQMKNSFATIVNGLF